MRNKGFTIIELLAVIIILVIIALIAIPIILNIISNTRINSIQLGVENYLDTIEQAVANETMKNPTLNYDGIYTITEEGKILTRDENTKLYPKYDGIGLKSGSVEIKGGKVIKLQNSKVTEKWFAVLENNMVKLYDELPVTYSTLSSYLSSNLQNLDENVTSNVTSIEFYSNGTLPEGYTKKQLTELSNTNVSIVEGEVVAYLDDDKIYVVSDNLISFNEDSSLMFESFEELTSIKFNEVDTSHVTNMGMMFEGCASLESLDIKDWDVSSVTDMNEMFYGCNALVTLDLSGWDTSSVAYTSFMFGYCDLLESLNLSNWILSDSFSSASNMFSNSPSLKTLNLSGWKISQIDKVFHNLFVGISRNSLEKIDTSNWEVNASENNEVIQIFFQMVLRGINVDVLDVSNWDISGVTNLSSMFAYNNNNIKSIVGLETWDVSHVTNMSNMFEGFSSANELKLNKTFNTNTTATKTDMFKNSSVNVIYVG